MKKLLLALCLLCSLFSACNTSKNILYMQDIPTGISEDVAPPRAVIIRPKDIIAIVVNSKNPELAETFNLARATPYIGNSAVSSSTYGQVSGYTVGDDGNIDFPVVGAIRVAGMTRNEIAAYIKRELAERGLLNDAVVTVDFLNLHISVLGEVGRPGEYRIDRDRITLLEAISQAGDLTIHGLRDRVLVIRETDGQRITYQVDLRTKDIFDSPAYYLQQNDVVYVQPNNVRAGQSTINENNLKSVSMWMSLASLMMSIAVFLFK